MLNSIGANLLTLNVDGIKFDKLDLTKIPAISAMKNFNMKDNSLVHDLSWITTLPNFNKIFAALEMIDAEGCTQLADINEIALLPALKTIRLSHTAIDEEQLIKLTKSSSISAIYLDGCHKISSV